MITDDLEMQVILYLRKKDLYRPSREIWEIIDICRKEPVKTAAKILLFDYRLGPTRDRGLSYPKKLIKLINEYDERHEAASKRIDSFFGI